MAVRASHSERRALRVMATELSSSDPELVLLFGNFTRLADGADLPSTERLKARTASRPWRHAPLRRAFFYTLFAIALAACWAFAIGSTGGAHRNGPAAPAQHQPRGNCAELQLWASHLGPKPALMC
jgi:hypothetical protein